MSLFAELKRRKVFRVAVESGNDFLGDDTGRLSFRIELPTGPGSRPKAEQ